MVPLYIACGVEIWSKRGIITLINKITINNTAAFKNDHIVEDLKKINYFFGANGTGKTTISRVINSCVDYPYCTVSWEHQTALETRVYNRDFVDKNFTQQKKLQGVFTLGETEQETLNNIERLKDEISQKQNRINTLNETLNGPDKNGGKNAELAKHIELYEEKFWKIKQDYADKLSGHRTGEGMRGVIGSKKDFMEKVLVESSNNTADLISQKELEEKAEKIFSNTSAIESIITNINITTILEYEKNPILKKRIIGKDDVDIFAMISKLNNSDWVKQGRIFFHANDGVCPFCQQKTNESFQKSLSEYFDDSFIKDSEKIERLKDNYSTESQRLQIQIENIINSQSNFIDKEKLKTEKQLFDSVIKVNELRIIEKQNESSRVITLESHENILESIKQIISDTNLKITENNRIITNLKKEKDILTFQIWKFVVSKLESDIAEYLKQKKDLENAIHNIKIRITETQKQKAEQETELKKLEQQVTSIIPTKDGINNSLKSFGFTNFTLDIGDEPSTYKLIREDGSGAHDTLSEGERNFLTFLYFYHLLKGNQSETGIESDKIVVIDDPVSSLDNDVLFIVSTLIRGLIKDTQENKGSIKQIFVLTHNIYFHKEVTYNKNSTSDQTFWLIKKNGSNSTVENHPHNPIKTSYELLWDEVRCKSRNNVTIQNTLRRILEFYFKILGDFDLDKTCENFEDTDKIYCKSLCSWINDGSHATISDELYTPLDDEMIEKHLMIFQNIFHNTGHIAHYNMMMKIKQYQQEDQRNDT